jgi:hypothetical protein
MSSNAAEIDRLGVDGDAVLSLPRRIQAAPRRFWRNHARPQTLQLLPVQLCGEAVRYGPVDLRTLLTILAMRARTTY